MLIVHEKASVLMIGLRQVASSQQSGAQMGEGDEKEAEALSDPGTPPSSVQPSSSLDCTPKQRRGIHVHGILNLLKP